MWLAFECVFLILLEMVFQIQLITKLHLSFKDYREMFWEGRDGNLNGAGGCREVEGLT